MHVNNVLSELSTDQTGNNMLQLTQASHLGIFIGTSANNVTMHASINQYTKNIYDNINPQVLKGNGNAIFVIIGLVMKII